MEKGKIIVIDGMDGTGKKTQSKLLYEKLKEKTDKVLLFSFPNYDDDSSYFVKKYLREGYCRDINNSATQSLFFAIDRSITFEKYLKDKYNEGYIIILDRYTTSNFIYNLNTRYSESSASLSKKDYCYRYYIMLNLIEFEFLNLPEPDLVIILYSDPKVSDNLIRSRYNDNNSKRDLNENLEFQKQIYENILFIKDNITDIFGHTVYFCIHNSNEYLYSIDYLHNKIKHEVELIL